MANQYSKQKSSQPVRQLVGGRVVTNNTPNVGSLEDELPSSAVVVATTNLGDQLNRYNRLQGELRMRLDPVLNSLSNTCGVDEAKKERILSEDSPLLSELRNQCERFVKANDELETIISQLVI